MPLAEASAGAPALERGDALLERRDGRVRQARIDVAEGLQVEQARRVVGAVEDEARRLVDRQRARAGRRVGDLAGVDRQGLGLEAVVGHASAALRQTGRRAEMTPVLTPAQCSPPNRRACSILTQRSITTSRPAAARQRGRLVVHRRRSAATGSCAPIAIACSAIGSTSSVRRKTSTMSTGSSIVAQAGVAALAEDLGVARVHRDDAVAVLLHVLGGEVARPVPLGRQADDGDRAARCAGCGEGSRCRRPWIAARRAREPWPAADLSRNDPAPVKAAVRQDRRRPPVHAPRASGAWARRRARRPRRRRVGLRRHQPGCARRGDDVAMQARERRADSRAGAGASSPASASGPSRSARSTRAGCAAGLGRPPAPRRRRAATTRPCDARDRRRRRRSRQARGDRAAAWRSASAQHQRLAAFPPASAAGRGARSARPTPTRLRPDRQRDRRAAGRRGSATATTGTPRWSATIARDPGQREQRCATPWRAAASRQPVAASSRGGDFQSSRQPVSAATTNWVWKSMRTGASSSEWTNSMQRARRAAAPAPPKRARLAARTIAPRATSPSAPAAARR